MKTKYRLATALKQLMRTTPLDLISVKTLTEKCNLNRQTFYYHFRNLYDLLMWIFLNEEVLLDTSTIDSALASLFIYLEEEDTLIENALNSAAKDLVMEFLFNKIYNMNISLFKDYYKYSKISKDDRTYYARFLGAGLSNVIIAKINEEITLNEQQVKANYKNALTAIIKELHTKNAGL